MNLTNIISGKGSAGATKRLLKEMERLQAMNKDAEVSSSHPRVLNFLSIGFDTRV